MIITAFGPVSTPGPAQSVGFRTGSIVFFNSLTLENIINVGGTHVFNLPLLGVAEYSTMVAGATVGLLQIRSDNGTTSYAIMGRFVSPGTQAAIDSLNALNDRMYAADNLGGTIGSTNSTTYVDFGQGPVVSGIRIGPSGRALVILGCNINSGTTEGSTGGEMTVAISGATTRGASSDYAYRAQAAIFGNTPSTVTVDTTFNDRACMVSIVHGLTPGVHAFTAWYAADSSSSTVTFSDPVVAVLAL